MTMEDDNNKSLTVDWDDLVDTGLSLQTDIPQANRFPGIKIFVRECYPHYYDMVTDLLSPKYRMVSVTGTQGIGTSVFGLYFFHRYRLMNPTKKVLVASFTVDRRLSRCCLYPALLDEQQAVAPQHFTSIPDDKVCDLYLFDGPPNHMPDGDSKVVAFTSPDPVWLNRIAAKYANHTEVYMPNWSFLEQQTANHALGLQLSTEELMRRNALFGGTARYVLTNDNFFVDTGAQLVFQALGGIRTLGDVQDMFSNRTTTFSFSHDIMHYFPLDNDVRKASFLPASKYISEEMGKNVRLQVMNAREKLQLMLEWAGKPSAFCSWLFGNSVHEQLLRGGEFTLKNLRKEGVDLSLFIDKTLGCSYKRFSTNKPIEEILQPTYAIPDVSSLEAFDSYLYDGSTLWLFQISLNISREVTLKGLLKLVDFLQLRSAVQKMSCMVKLVFVVPSSSARNCRVVQPIVMDHVFTVSSAALGTTDCSEVPGIGPLTKRKLHKKGISNVSDLLHAPLEDDLLFVKASVENFKKDLDLMTEAAIQQWSQEIDQYVLEID